MKELTELQKKVIDEISAMDHYSMCRLWRYAPAGHPYFDKREPYAEIFRKRLFEHFGGFTASISKSFE